MLWLMVTSSSCLPSSSITRPDSSPVIDSSLSFREPISPFDFSISASLSTISRSRLFFLCWISLMRACREFFNVFLPTSSDFRRGSLVFPLSVASLLNSSILCWAPRLSSMNFWRSSSRPFASACLSMICASSPLSLSSRSMICVLILWAASLPSSSSRRLNSKAMFLCFSSSLTCFLISSIRADAISIFLSASLSWPLASFFFISYSLMPTRSSSASILSLGVRSLSLVAVPCKTML